jgi:hypothetical protein
MTLGQLRTRLPAIAHTLRQLKRLLCYTGAGVVRRLTTSEARRPQRAADPPARKPGWRRRVAAQGGQILDGRARQHRRGPLQITWPIFASAVLLPRRRPMPWVVSWRFQLAARAGTGRCGR